MRRVFKLWLFGAVLCPALLLTVPVRSQVPSQSHSVETAKDAIAAAHRSWASVNEKASWQKVYSNESVAKFEPYTAILDGNVWHVRGTIPPGYHGQAPEAHISKTDGHASVAGVDVR